MKCTDGQYFEPPQVNMGDDTTETFLDQVLAAPSNHPGPYPDQISHWLTSMCAPKNVPKKQKVSL